MAVMRGKFDLLIVTTIFVISAGPDFLAGRAGPMTQENAGLIHCLKIYALLRPLAEDIAFFFQ